MEIFGLVAALLIGISLGLLGGGGSILTIPVLVYLFQVEPIIATTYSLLIIGITSIFGALGYIKKRQINFKAVWLFGIPSIITVLLSRSLLLPAIPNIIISNSFVTLNKSQFILLLFSIIMLFAGWKMTQKTPVINKQQTNKLSLPQQGTIVGLVTGIVGAGGGFLIIPALVIWLGLPMKTAIGTSLIIIALNSLVGFFGGVNFMQLDWSLLIKITIIALAGLLIGMRISNKINSANLKPMFGWFVVIMGMFILLKELINIFY